MLLLITVTVLALVTTGIAGLITTRVAAAACHVYSDGCDTPHAGPRKPAADPSSAPGIPAAALRILNTTDAGRRLLAYTREHDVRVAGGDIDAYYDRTNTLTLRSWASPEETAWTVAYGALSAAKKFNRLDPAKVTRQNYIDHSIDEEIEVAYWRAQLYLHLTDTGKAQRLGDGIPKSYYRPVYQRAINEANADRVRRHLPPLSDTESQEVGEKALRKAVASYVRFQRDYDWARLATESRD